MHARLFDGLRGCRSLHSVPNAMDGRTSRDEAGGEEALVRGFEEQSVPEVKTGRHDDDDENLRQPYGGCVQVHMRILRIPAVAVPIDR